MKKYCRYFFHKDTVTIYEYLYQSYLIQEMANVIGIHQVLARMKKFMAIFEAIAAQSIKQTCSLICHEGGRSSINLKSSIDRSRNV